MRTLTNPSDSTIGVEIVQDGDYLLAMCAGCSSGAAWTWTSVGAGTSAGHWGCDECSIVFNNPLGPRTTSTRDILASDLEVLQNWIGGWLGRSSSEFTVDVKERE